MPIYTWYIVYRRDEDLFPTCVRKDLTRADLKLYVIELFSRPTLVHFTVVKEGFVGYE